MNRTESERPPALPDLAQLTSAPAGVLRAFAARLREIGLTLGRTAPVVSAVEPIAPHLRAPIRAYHLRRMREPVGYAMRALLFGDPVTEAEAREALGPLLQPMLEIGLVARAGPDAVVSPFRLSIVDDLFVICDDLALGGEAVMGLGATTSKLCRAAAARGPLGRALDLGCGAGTCALVLSRIAREVVATDISERAVALCRINAALNGIGNVSVRQGDLFTPVRGEAFDLVVSQPPFVPRPDGAKEASFLYGGAVGDEIALRLFATIAPHLAEEGRALVVVEWPERGGAAIEERIGGAIGRDDVDTLVLRTPTTSSDEHAVAYAAGAHAALGDDFERDARLRREHLERLGIEGLTLTLVVLRRRRRSAPAWTRVVNVAAWPAIDPTARRIDAMVAAQDLVGDAPALLRAKLRMPAGTVLSEEQDGPGADLPSRVLARFSGEALAVPIGLPHDLLMVATMVHEAETVEQGIGQFAEAHEVAADAAASRLVPALERLLAAGAFEVQPDR